MSLTDWKNLPSTETPVNAENLKNDSNELNNKINGTTLYSNGNGTNGEVTLSENFSNYRYLMVYWQTTYNSLRKGVSLASCSTGYWSLFSFDIDINTYQTVYYNETLYYLAGNKMTVSKANNYNGQNANVFYITKVVGYK